LLQVLFFHYYCCLLITHHGVWTNIPLIDSGLVLTLLHNTCVILLLSLNVLYIALDVFSDLKAQQEEQENPPQCQH
jgi:hypothetical protein